MKIVNVGYNYKHSENFRIYRPYGSGDYILLVLRTNAFFVLNGKRQASLPNAVILFKKGTPQIYGAQGGEFINDWIHFEMEEEEIPAFAALGIPFDTVVPVDSTAELSGIIKSMFVEKYSRNMRKEDSLKLYFELILLKLHEKIKMPDLKKENPYYNEFSLLRNEIYLSPEKDWRIDDISRKMRLSRSYTQHLYKSFFDTSITENIINSRMEYAKYLLSSTDMTITAISGRCGYHNDVHFMRIFKKKMGVTPSQYKKQMHVVESEMEDAKKRNPFCL